MQIKQKSIHDKYSPETKLAINLSKLSHHRNLVPIHSSFSSFYGQHERVQHADNPPFLI